MKRLWYIILQVLLFPKGGECQNALGRQGRHDRLCPYNASLKALPENDVAHVVLRGDGWGPFDDFQHAAVCISAATVIVLGQCNANTKRGAKRLGFLLIQRYFDSNCLLDPANLKIWDSLRRISDLKSSREKSRISELANTIEDTVFESVKSEDTHSQLKKNNQDQTDPPESGSGVNRDAYSWLFNFRGTFPTLDFIVAPFNTLDGYFKDVLNNASISQRMRYEWARYESFQNFPADSPAMPSRLAKSGFYYSNCGDEVTCYSCHTSYRGWKSDDIPSDVHVKISPSCSHAIGVDLSNMPIHPDTNNNNQTSLEVDGGQRRNVTEHYTRFSDPKPEICDNIRSDVRTKPETPANGECAVSSVRSAGTQRHPDMEDLSRRLDTFDNCPQIDTGNWDAAEIVNCGYFYSDSGRCLRCYSCGAGVRPLDAPVSDLWNSHDASCPLLMQHDGKGRRLNEKKHEHPPSFSSSTESGKHRNIVNGHGQVYNHGDHFGQANTVGYVFTETASWLNDIQQGSFGEGVRRKTTPGDRSTRATVSQIDEVTAHMVEMGFEDEQIQKTMTKLRTNGRKITTEAMAEILCEATACHQKEESHCDVTDKIKPETKSSTLQKRIDKVSQKDREECARMRQQLACKICLDQEACMVIMPCGHLTSCPVCTLKLRKCPICRKLIKRTIKASM